MPKNGRSQMGSADVRTVCPSAAAAVRRRSGASSIPARSGYWQRDKLSATTVTGSAAPHAAFSKPAGTSYPRCGRRTTVPQSCTAWSAQGGRERGACGRAQTGVAVHRSQSPNSAKSSQYLGTRSVAIRADATHAWKGQRVRIRTETKSAVRAEAASSLRMRTGSPLQMRALLLLGGRCPMACPDGTMHPAEMALGSVLKWLFAQPYGLDSVCGDCSLMRR